MHNLGSVALLLSCCWLHRCDTTEMSHPSQSLMEPKSRRKVINTITEGTKDSPVEQEEKEKANQLYG